MWFKVNYWLEHKLDPEQGRGEWINSEQWPGERHTSGYAHRRPQEDDPGQAIQSTFPSIAITSLTPHLAAHSFPSLSCFLEESSGSSPEEERGGNIAVEARDGGHVCFHEIFTVILGSHTLAGAWDFSITWFIVEGWRIIQLWILLYKCKLYSCTSAFMQRKRNTTEYCCTKCKLYFRPLACMQRIHNTTMDTDLQIQAVLSTISM